MGVRVATTLRARIAASGMTLVEWLLFLVWIACGAVGAALGCDGWGVPGAAAGLGLGCALPVLFGLAIQRLDALRFPDLPTCRSGRCDARGGYRALDARSGSRGGRAPGPIGASPRPARGHGWRGSRHNVQGKALPLELWRGGLHELGLMTS